MNPWIKKIKIKKLSQMLTLEFGSVRWDDNCASKVHQRAAKLIESLGLGNTLVELEITFRQFGDNSYCVEKITARDSMANG